MISIIFWDSIQIPCNNTDSSVFSTHMSKWFEDFNTNSTCKLQVKVPWTYFKDGDLFSLLLFAVGQKSDVNDFLGILPYFEDLDIFYKDTKVWFRSWQWDNP